VARSITDDHRPPGVPHEAPLLDASDERREAGATRMRELEVDCRRPCVVEISILEFHRSDEKRLRPQFGEAMEHQRPMASAVRTQLEAGSVRRNGVRPNAP